MTTAEIVHQMDQIYTLAPQVCPREGQIAKLAQSGVSSELHGHLTVHGSGAYLVCGMCDTKVPTGRI